MAQKGLKLNNAGFNTDFANRTGEEVGQFARRFGVPHNGLESTTQNVLQPGYAAHAAAVQSIGDIPKSEVLAAVQAQIGKELGSKVPASNEFAKKVLSQAQGVLDNFGDTIPATELNAVKSEIAAQVNHAATDTASKSANEVLNRVSGGFRNAINTAANTAGVGVDPSLAKLGYKSKTVGDLGEEVHNLQDLLTKADRTSRTGNGSNPIHLTPAVMYGSGGQAGVGAAVAAQIANSNAGRKGIAKGLDAIASRADNAALKSGSPYTLANVGKRVVGGDIARGTVNQSPNSIPTTTNTSTDPTASNMLPSSQNLNDLSSSSLGQDTASASPYGQENLMYDIQRDPKNADKYLTLYSSLDKIFNPSDSKTAIKPTSQQYGLAQGGMNALNQLSQLIQQDPSVINRNATLGQGLPVVGSLISNAAGAGSYHPLADSVLQSLIHLQTGATATPEEVKAARGQLPAPGDSPEEQQRKLQNLAQMFSPFVQGGNTAGTTNSPTDLASALASMGYGQ
jgi:hypothetical protein